MWPDSVSVRFPLHSISDRFGTRSFHLILHKLFTYNILSSSFDGEFLALVVCLAGTQIGFFTISPLYIEIFAQFAQSVHATTQRSNSLVIRCVHMGFGLYH